MFQLPFYIFFFIYLVIALVAVLIFYISYHHIHSTGTLKGGALFTTLIMGGLLTLVLGGTLIALSTTNWSEPITVGDNLLFEGPHITLFP